MGLYERSWAEAADEFDAQYLGTIHDSDITWAQNNTLMRYRHGCLWNAKKAAMIDIPYQAARRAQPRCSNPLAACPLCGCEDGGTHMLSECSHPLIKGLVIERHNDVVRLIGKEVRATERFQDAVLLMDCSESDRQECDAQYSRVPDWLLHNTPAEQRQRMRPDILVVEGLSVDDVRGGTVPPRAKQECRIHIIEVGYGADTRLGQKRKEKEKQHEALRRSLVEAGWQVEPPHLILVGHGGGIGKTTSHFIRQTLGRKETASRRIIERIIKNTATRAQQIIGTRRKLERNASDAKPD